MSNVSISDLKRTSTMVAKDAGIGSVKKFFESQKATMLAVLPKHMDTDRMLKIALGALRTTPKLMNARIDTLFGAVIQCAQLGLEPNTPLGHAFLIPFDKKQKIGNEWKVVSTEVQIIFGYKGLIDLARRSGQVVSISAHEVCEKDHFEYEYGLDEKLVHRPAMGERGAVVAFYAVAKLVGGGYAFEVMGTRQVEEIRDASQNYKAATNKSETVWGKNFVEMGRKTVLRRLFKYLPVSIELATAAALDERSASGLGQGLEDVLQGEFNVLDTEGDSYAGNDDEQVDTATGEVSRAAPAQQAPAQIEHQDSGPALHESMQTRYQQTEPLLAQQEAPAQERTRTRRTLE